MGLPNTNPVEFNNNNYELNEDEQGMPWSYISFKNRETTMLKCVLAGLNGE
jgi:hypothetical protein